MSIDTILVILIFGVAYMSARTTYMVLMSDMFENVQKVAIVAITWVIPVIGPILIGSFLKVEISSRSTDERNLFDAFFLCDALTHWSNSLGSKDSNNSSSHGGADGNDT